MTSDVVLTAALRNNLLSLQRTQKSIDTTQLRLATGLKVNSALDNPQNFFAANALKNRAGDLQRLLDGIGQNIQVIKAADNGVTALTKLVEQADSVAQSARDALAQGTAEAKIVGDKDLSGTSDLVALSGITSGDTITISVTDPDDGSLIDFDETTTATQENLTITISSGDSIDELITQINDNNNIDVPVIEASLDSDGRLQIRTLNGGDFRAVLAGGGGAGDTDSEDLALAEALGFGNIARSAGDQQTAGDTSIEFSVVADVALRSFDLYYQDGAGDLQTALRSSLLSDLRDSEDQLLFANVDDTDDEYVISINGGEQQTIELHDGTNAVTLQAFIDGINDNDALNTLIKAEFNEETGQVSIRALSAEVQSIQIGVEDAVTANFGFGLVDNPDDPVGLTSVAGEQFLENIQIGSAAALLGELEVEFNNIRDQIDQLVSNGDTGYRGTNLLNGDDLVTFFNEFRQSKLTTEGVTFNSAGLGLDEADFSRAEAVDTALANVRSALESVRNFGTTLANDLAIIQTRQDFTEDLINTLNEGADKLTVADQNEEGTKLLALQTRQQLGVTSLALASQSQQSILRLF